MVADRRSVGCSIWAQERNIREPAGASTFRCNPDHLSSRLVLSEEDNQTARSEDEKNARFRRNILEALTRWHLGGEVDGMI